MNLIVLLVFSLTGYGCSKKTDTYDDCVLASLRDTKIPQAIASVKASCRGKFPVAFDWDDLGKKTGFKTWSEVKQNPKFHALSNEDKRAAKEEYWREVLKPHVRNDFWDDAHDKFMSEK